MRRSTVAGAALAAGAAYAVVRLVDDYLGPPREPPDTRFDWLRRFNKAAFNPLLLAVAPADAPYIGVIRHVGRVSGRPYETPVIAVPVEGGFVVPLPYGRGTDWCRNVLAAGGTTLRYRGQEIALADPVLLDRDAAQAAVGEPYRRLLGLFGIGDYLRLARTAAAASPGAPAVAAPAAAGVETERG